MEYKDLTRKQKLAVQAAANPEEILELAKADGLELTDDELAAVAGGWGGNDCVETCPTCGGTSFPLDHTVGYDNCYKCDTCGTIIQV